MTSHMPLPSQASSRTSTTRMLFDLIVESGAEKRSLCAGCPTQGAHSDSGLSSALSLLTQTLPDQTTQHATPTAQSPASFSSPPSSSFWQRSAGADSAKKDESSPAGNMDESSAAGAESSSSTTAWQSAAENANLHAMVLRHMCQQSRDTQTEPNAASSATSCSYGDAGSTQAREVYC